MTLTSKQLKPLLSARLTAAIGLALGTAPLSTFAQEKILEEVIVTSQKRAQSIMDVPISVAAVTGDKIEKAGIENISDLTVYVPNIHLTETGLSTQLRIRGVGSDNSQGFEQSVGVYKDGVYHSRAQLFRAPIFDVERVEVMRGPQNTLFGKNSISGALDIITAKPDDEFAGKLTASYEAEFGTQELSGFITGALTDNLNARLAVRAYDDPGYMENTFKNTDEPNRDETSVRASVSWAATDNLDVLLIVEHNDFDLVGRAVEITQDLPSLNPNLGGATFSQLLPNFSGGVTFDNQLDYKRQTDASEFSNNAIDSQTLIIDYDWNDYTITATTGLLKLDYTENCDCDFTPAPTLSLDLAEDYKQMSQEIRIASPLGNKIEWLGGVFYQNFEQTFTDLLSVPGSTPLIGILAVAPEPRDISAIADTAYHRDFEQTSDAWAIFAEATWHIHDELRLILGGRYTEEEKESTKIVNIVSIAGAEPAPIANPQLAVGLGQLYYGIFNADSEQLAGIPRPTPGFNLADTRDETAFTPSLTLSWDVNNDLMTYLKYSKGFKAGGFDPRSNNSSRFEFEDESVTALELGSKWVVADGAGELNVALFYSDYKDLQTSQFDGAVGFNVGNADGRSQGLEIDGRWQIAEHWLASYGASYLDFEYTDYPFGNCYFDQTGVDGFCDNTGKTGTHSPAYTYNGSLEYARPMSAKLDFVTVLDAQWVDKHQVHNNLDPLGVIGSYTMLGLRIGVEAEHWSLALLGKNLLDEDVITSSSNMPLSETLFNTNSYYSFVRRPMTVALEGTLKF